MSHDADDRVRQLGAIDACCIDLRVRDQKNGKNEQPTADASTHSGESPTQQK
jgi:hypothetical protein